MFKKLKEANDAFIAQKKAERTAALNSPEGQEQLKTILDKYGLNLEAYTKQDLVRLNANDLQKITKSMFGNKAIQAGMALSFAKAEEQAKVSYLGALVDQNWIIIRQNEAILKTLEKLGTNG